MRVRYLGVHWRLECTLPAGVSPLYCQEGTRIGVSVSLPPFSCPLSGENGGVRRGEFAAAKLVVFAAAKLPFKKKRENIF